MKRIIVLGLFIVGLLTITYWSQPKPAKAVTDRIPHSDSKTSTAIVTVASEQK